MASGLSMVPMEANLLDVDATAAFSPYSTVGFLSQGMGDYRLAASRDVEDEDAMIRRAGMTQLIDSPYDDPVHLSCRAYGRMAADRVDQASSLP